MIKTGYIQFHPVLGEIDGNIQRINPFIDQTKDADLIVLPELISTGYNFESRHYALNCAEEINNSRFVEFLISKSKEHNAYIVAGINEKNGDELFNTSVLIGPNGYLGKYQKIHLFMNEKDIFKTGSVGVPVFDVEFGKLSMLICFDYYFPELWRMTGLNGADIICHPSNLLTQNAHKTVPAQAFMNKVFIITSNRIGTENDLTFNGTSFIVNPDAEVILKASVDKEEVGMIEIDPQLARNKFVTSRNHAFNDRHPGLYKGLV